MSLIKPLSFIIEQGDLDGALRPLQLLETIHRTSIMPVARGRVPEGASMFDDPTVGTPNGYYGFGKDGSYYEDGVKLRTWRAQESIDDFSDKVTDPDRWAVVGGSPDMIEGGIDAFVPFGRRLHAIYVGAGAEIYERQGLMVATPGTSFVLSGRVRTPGEGSPEGVDLENSILLAVQQSASPTDFVFVGYANTATHPFSVVMGEFVAGAPTVTAAVALPALTVEATIAIELTFASGYRGHFSVTPNDEDYTGGSWAPLAAYSPVPAGWPTTAVPRIRASFPAGIVPGEMHNITDVRNEVGSNDFVGDQRASWWLEPLDGTNPTDLAGTQQEAPDEIFVTWERDKDGQVHLSLIDVDAPAAPLLWRRWKNLGVWKDWTRQPMPFWSPGWMHAEDGHIIMTRDTTRADEPDNPSTGEVWVVSLRWDKVIIFHRDGLGTYLSRFGPSGEINRELGSWGARQWFTNPTYQPITNYDQTNQPSSPFVGTYKHATNETTTPTITYGCHLRRGDDDLMYLAYGVQGAPAELPATELVLASVITLNEGPALTYPRALSRKNSDTYNVWDESDENWVVVGMTHDRALYWLQAGEEGPGDSLEGLLCRIAAANRVNDNNSFAATLEDNSWGNGAADLFGGRGFSLFVQDTVTPGEEILVIGSGWLGGGHVTLFFRDDTTPAASVRQTYGPVLPNEQTSYGFKRILPADEFPRWMQYALSPVTADLQRLRTAMGAGLGSDSFLPVSGGFSLVYGQWNGIAAESFNYDVMRSVPIDRSDFVLDLDGRYSPPFTAGYGLDTINQMPSTQTFKVCLRVLGEKKLRGEVCFLVTGNEIGVGGIQITTLLTYQGGGGEFNQVDGYVPGSLAQGWGSRLRLRIKRVGQTWSFLYFDPSFGVFVEVMSAPGLRVPLLGLITAELQDSAGIPAGVGIEIDSFTLAPADDPQGQPFARPLTFRQLPSTLASAVGGTTSREKIPTATGGVFVLGDSWSLAGLMPRP